MNIFELASREKFRFPSTKGELTTEQLWQLPLLDERTFFDLNSVAKAISTELKDMGEENFVQKAQTSIRRPALEAKLEIVKYIIASHQQAIAEHAEASNKAETKRRLLDLLARKEDKALEELTADQIRDQLKAL